MGTLTLGTAGDVPQQHYAQNPDSQFPKLRMSLATDLIRWFKVILIPLREWKERRLKFCLVVRFVKILVKTLRTFLNGNVIVVFKHSFWIFKSTGPVFIVGKMIIGCETVRGQWIFISLIVQFLRVVLVHRLLILEERLLAFLILLTLMMSLTPEAN